MHDDRGQVVPLFAGVVVVALACAVLLVRLGVAADQRARAQAAADAAALAAAGHGEEAARSVAAANGAEIVELTMAGGHAVVEVRVGEARAEAAARREAPPPGAADASVEGLAPEMAAAVARAEALLGRPLRITSGFRSRTDQERLWRNRHRNPYPVARPGTSAHERGVAIDVAASDVVALLAVAPRVGLCQPLPRSDPIHFELCPKG